MKKTALLFFALFGLPAALWTAAQPARVPCPEMRMAAGERTPEPCPQRDCCRLALPEAPPAALVAASAEVRTAGIFLLPILLQTRTATPPALRDFARAPAGAVLIPHKPPPSAQLIPLRV